MSYSTGQARLRAARRDHSLSGVLLLSRYSPTKHVWHYAVLVCGPRTHFGLDAWPLWMVELQPAGFVWMEYHENDAWVVAAVSQDERAATARLEADLALDLPYHAVLNNCEHFARFVVHGRRESLQVLGAAALVVAVVSLVVYASTRRRAA